ncbi:MAG: CpaF family protein [Anaerolineae bacterium]|nr:CpaF family protein [Anaerolineae bacterium]
MYDNTFYNQITTRIQDYLVTREVPVPRWRGAHPDEELAFHAWILRAMRELRIGIDERDRQDVTREISKRIIGLGVLQPFLEEDGIEEIIVRNGFVLTERDGQIQDEGYLAGRGPSGDQYFYRLARRIAEMEGIGLGGKEPKIKVGLPDGSRFAATIPPLSREGTAINIRRFARRKLSLVDLVDRGSADKETIDLLTEVAASMLVSVVFAGRPGAGKTTWLNAFSAHLPAHAQVTVVETFEELQPQVEHFHHLVVEDEEGEMGEAINTSVLRMRPDVLMIGEVVSREAYQYVMALNLGIVSHTTTHSQSALMALARLENLARRDMSVDELRPVLGNGLRLVIHLAKQYNAERRQYVRYMNEMVAILGYEDGHYVTKVLKQRQGDGYTPLAGGMELLL